KVNRQWELRSNFRQEAGAPGQSRGIRMQKPGVLVSSYQEGISSPEGDRIPSFFAKERKYDAGTVFQGSSPGGAGLLRRYRLRPAAVGGQDLRLRPAGLLCE